MHIQGASAHVHDDFVKLAFMVDSGASETVMSAELFKEHPMTMTSDTGEAIVNQGEKYLEVYDESGASSWAKFQVCTGFGKDKVLASVSRLVQTGHSVVFQSPVLGSYVENGTNGYRMYVRQESGAYHLGLWVNGHSVDGVGVMWKSPVLPGQDGIAKRTPRQHTRKARRGCSTS